MSKENKFIRDQDKGKDITVDLTGKDEITKLENDLEEIFPNSKVIAHHAKYSSWQIIKFENPDTYIMARTVFRLVRNVVQLLTLEELIMSKQDNKDEFLILEYSISQDKTHDDMDTWNNPQANGSKRIVNDYYIDRDELIKWANEIINDWEWKKITTYKELISLEDAKLCFNCLNHFDYAKKGYYIRISQGKPRKTILKITFCSEKCYKFGMSFNNLELIIEKKNRNLKFKTWLEHPLICNCEICISENL